MIVDNDARHWEYLIANLAASEGLFSCVNSLYIRELKNHDEVHDDDVC